jgi:hypothetical protein
LVAFDSISPSPLDIGQLRLEISGLEELARQLFLELHEMKEMQERQRWSATLQGKYFNILGHFFSLYCIWKIFICTINIIFDRVGKKDVVTRGIEIAVEWCGIQFDIAFWSQHISFLLVGCIVITSIRGLLITLTKVREKMLQNLTIFPISLDSLPVFLQNLIQQIVQHDRADPRPAHGHVLLLLRATDANEHASRVSSHHHRSPQWASIQLLPPVVRRDLLVIGFVVDFPSLHHSKADGGGGQVV